jgi:hypothetical protein
MIKSRPCVAVAFTLVAASLGLAVVRDPLLAAAPLAVIGLVLLTQSAVARSAFVIFGGLATLQSSQNLDATKLAYLLGSGVALSVACLSLADYQSAPWRPLLDPLFRASAVWIALILLSSMVAYGSGTPLSTWLRDAIPYLLFACVPILVHDLRARSAGNWLLPLFVVAGTLGTAAFAVEWVRRRQYVDLPIDRLLLSSFLLPVAIYCYALASALHGRRRVWLWASLAALVLALYAVTGTRTSMILLFVPFAVVPGGEGTARRCGRLVALGAVIVVVSLLVVQLLGQVTTFNPAESMSRLRSITDVFGSSAAGQSYTERALQTRASWEAFRAAPLFGVGPGYQFHWFTDFSGARSAFNIDSPLAIAAKFGLLGIITLGYTAGQYWRALRALRSNSASFVNQAALRGFLLVVGAFSLLGSAFEDKGLSFALIFLIVLGAFGVPTWTPSGGMTQTSKDS